MLKKAAFFLLSTAFCLSLALGGEKTLELRIADTLPEVLPVLKGAAMRMAMQNNVAVSFERTDIAQALSGVADGKYDLVLAVESALPENAESLERVCFGIDTLAVYLNSMNLVDNGDEQVLKKVWISNRPVWRLFGGGNRQIHLMGIKNGRPGAGIFRFWLGRENSPGAYLGLNTTREMLIMTGDDTEALGVSRFAAGYPVDKVKVIAVNGVIPSPETIRGGKYPLAWRYVALGAKKESFAAQSFIELLSGEEFKDKLESAGLFLP